MNKFYIYKDRLINNINIIKNQNPNSQLCAMVKANAYGIGLNQVVKIIKDSVDFFGVVNYLEAKQVRALCSNRILIVGAMEYKRNLDLSFSYSCSNLDDLRFLIKQNKPFKIHLKINSGMNRFGFKSIKQFKQALKLIENSKLILEGVFTHFATCDNYVQTQMERFNKFLRFVKTNNLIVHTDNSAVNLKFNHHFNMVRIGFNLYNNSTDGFKPVAEIYSPIVQINKVKKGELVGYNRTFIAKQDILVAVIPIGYADGLDMRNIGKTLIVKNVSCKILNICMDCFMLNISKIKIKKGEEIAILNSQNSLINYAQNLNTSVYEVMCKFSFVRAKRIIK